MLSFVYPMNNHSVIMFFQCVLNHGFKVAVHADPIIQELHPDCDRRTTYDN